MHFTPAPRNTSSPLTAVEKLDVRARTIKPWLGGERREGG
jgi:hypothetical protein